MKCNKCNFETAEDFIFCPSCGAHNTEPVIPVNFPDQKILNLLKDKGTLVLCILLTVSSGLGVISGSIPVLTVLATIFMWLVYSKACNDITDSGLIRCVSGTVYAAYIINYIGYVLLAIIGVCFGITFGVSAGSPSILEAVLQELEAYFTADILNTTHSIITTYGLIISIAVIIFSIILVIINLIGMRKIHLFIKTTYQNLQNGLLENKYTEAAKNWLIFFGVFTVIGGLSSLSSETFFAGIGNIALGVSMFLSSSLIKKHLL
ncbi:MAG: zinc ribbon domain-containing protein [Acutalibacteraceae bacterium]|nr:zinc ribbon domain-containing protein [Acutalibacteraceae bacterium]